MGVVAESLRRGAGEAAHHRAPAQVRLGLLAFCADIGVPSMNIKSRTTKLRTMNTAIPSAMSGAQPRPERPPRPPSVYDASESVFLHSNIIVCTSACAPVVIARDATIGCIRPLARLG